MSKVENPTRKDTFRRRPWKPLTELQSALSDSIKEKAEALEEEILKMNKSREQALALTNLEQAVMWAAKGVNADG